MNEDHSPFCPCHKPSNMPRELRISRRNFLKAGAVASTGLLLPEHSFAAGGDQSIKDMRGFVYVNRRLASYRTPIRPGDTVSVAHNGHVNFVVERDAYLLRGGSSMRIDAGDNGWIRSLSLFTGAFLGVFEKGRQRKVITRHATIGIRGTGIYLDTKPQETYFCTCYGQTELTVGDQREIVTAEHHQAMRILTPRNGQYSFDRTIGMVGHHDDELRRSESYVGRVVPFDNNLV